MSTSTAHGDESGAGFGVRVAAPDDFVPFDVDDVDRSIAERLEWLARRHGDRLAIKAGDRTLTYSELNRQANRFAHVILEKHPRRPWNGQSRNDVRSSGADAEPVAVCVGQGIDAIAAMFGLLKAGEVYVPIDPADPRARIEFILGDTGARAVVTDSEYLGTVKGLVPAGCDVINIDQLDHRAGDEDVHPAIPRWAPAYVIYTSGSTRQPKGVVHSQQNLLHQVMTHTTVQCISKSDRMSLLAWGTGLANSNTFSALLNGASLHLWNTKRDGLTRLAAWLLEERITICSISSPLYRGLLDLLTGKEEFQHLRVVRLASDKVYPEDLARFKEHFSDECFFVNALSSLETGLLCANVMDRSTRIVGAAVPVGYLVDDIEVELLDDSGALVGVNQIGAIAVRSRYLTRGYWRRPEQTEAVFQPDPDDPEVQTYRSEDLARWRPDGALEHVGRKDSVVKIRGYRVETTEVESALLEHDNVMAVVSRPYEDDRGEKQLVAYVVPRTPPAPTVSALHRFLGERLSEHMIPSAFVVLDAIPLLPSGKTNRRALPPPGRTRPELDNAYVAARTSTEETLVDIWSQVLHLDHVGIDDHFMELGGDSLRASQVISRTLEAFGVDLPLRRLFESPTVAQLATAIERRRAARVREGNGHAIGRHVPTGPCELSYGQERLWFLHQLDPDSRAYIMPGTVNLKGPLDVAALRESLDLIVARHDVLRTSIQLVDDAPRAVVNDPVRIDLPVIDLTNEPGDQREAELDRLVREQSARPFDLERDLKLRCVLYRLGIDEHVLLHITHHIASDRWSRIVMLRELVAHYEALALGQPSPLAPLPIQYSDYARWQRDHRQTRTFAAQLEYWKRSLDHLPRAMELPTDRRRPAFPSSRGDSHSFDVGPELTRALRELARREGVTVFMLLLAAFKGLLHRYTGRHDIVVGCPVAGRNRVETEGLIGFFVNTVVVRTDLGGDPTFRELLDRVRDGALNAYGNADIPFEKLVEEIQPDRDLSRNPLFQITFDVFTSGESEVRTAGLAFARRAFRRQTSPFDQAWSIAITEEGLRGRIEYNTDLFDPDTIERMTDHWCCLLEGGVHQPEQRLSGMPLLTEAERHRLLFEWNETATDDVPGCVHELFEAQVDRTPDAVAVVFEEEALTYGQLNARANQLAHHLRSLGVGPHGLVPIHVERSLQMLVGLLGILKAGAAYLPLDPADPRQRLALKLDDSRARVLVTQTSLVEALPETAARVVCLDGDAEAFALESDSNPVSHVTPDHLAYVIYTSGSTGSPRGVQIQHDSVVNLLRAMRERPGINARDTLLAVTTVSFDISVLELFLPLVVGARVVIVSGEVAMDGSRLSEELRRTGATILQATPATWRMLLDADWPGNARLKILCGGEAFPPALAARLHEQGGSVWNLYGPTETTIYSTVLQVDAVHGTIPIGRPIANTKLYVLDRNLQPVPTGVPGELHIAGVGVARGYLHRPELTAERFIQSPFGDKGERLYGTGDLVRWLPDGNLEFLGRMDHQVKVRGFRVEPGEIEAALGQHPQVRECVVIAGETSPGEQRLVAYIVWRDAVASGAREVRQFLGQSLPEHMIPAVFVSLDRLPLSRSGKVNRQQLPPPEEARPDTESTYVAPRTPLEIVLAEIWCEVLDLERVGVDDNFFELGGHSLLATRVANRVRNALQLELPIRKMFESPTIAELSQVLSAD